MRSETTTLTSPQDGLPLFVRTWLPDGDAKGAVQLAHGMAEHSGRYERLARALTSRGTALERFTRMGEAYLAFAEEEPGYYAAIFDTRSFGAPVQAAETRPGPFDLLVEALRSTFPAGFGGVDPRFVALEVWALSHGLATLAAAGQLPKGPGVPDKYELLRAGVLAIVHGAGSPAQRQGP